MSAATLFGASGSGVDDGGGVVQVPPGLTELEFVWWMLDNGLMAPQIPHQKAPPGYKAPDPVSIDVPNEALGIGPPHGVQHVKSLESVLQIAVQGLAGRIATQGWSDAKVRADLVGEAGRALRWLAGRDPASNDVPGLIEKYVAIYRKAVTPV